MLKLLGLGDGSSAAAAAAAASAAATATTAHAAAAGVDDASGSGSSSGGGIVEGDGQSSRERSASAGAGATATAAAGGMTLAAAMSEIEARFLLNLPEEELASVERLFFQLEQAHWYYEDFLADAHPDALPHFGLEGFTAALFTHSDCLRHLQEAHADLLKAFNSYKYAVPVYGCVLLSPGMDQLLLVCNWEGTTWGLPRGKVNEGETPMDCAAREVLEETGYDVAGRLREEDSFTMVQNAKRLKMYIVRGVPEDYPFEPRVRKEVSAVKFWPLDQVPQRSYNVVHSVAHVRHWMSRLSKRSRGGASDGDSGKQGQQGQGQGQQRRDPSNGRAGSRGKGKQAQAMQAGGGRAQSAPNGGRARSGGRQHRREDACDANNAETFGAGGPQQGTGEQQGWGVDDMFQANEKLTGRKFTYDGNPHRFGDYEGKEEQPPQPQPGPRPSPQKQRGGDKGGGKERGRAATVPAVRSLHEIEASLPGSSSTSTNKKGSSPKQQQALPPAVASLLSGIAAASAPTPAPQAVPVAVLSCASLEQPPQQEPGPALGDFTFDTNDILSALHF